MKKLFSILLLAAMLTGMAACGESAGGERDTLTYIALYPSDSLVPLDISLCEPNVMHAVYDGLVKFDTNGDIVPRLAESWEDSSEKTVFHLAQDATFHDGSPVTADDVIFTMDLYFNQGAYAYNFEERISSYEKNDDYTVTIYKTAPYIDLLTFSIENIWILPQDAYESDPEGFAEHPIGSGPYTFESLDSDGTVTLKAFEDYHLGAPEVKNVIVKPPVDPSTAIIALETGEADLVMDAPISQLSLLEGNEDVAVVLDPSTWSANTLMGLNDRLAADPNLRKAIYHGISRENAIKLANEGIGEPAVDPFSRRIMGDFAGIEYGPTYDPELAREYLEKSNYDGQPITITIWQESYLAQSVQSDLMELGIDIEIEQVDSTAWVDMLVNGELEMTIAPLGTFSSTIESMLITMSSESASYGGNMEISPEYDELVARIKQESDEAVRHDLIGQALELLYDRAVAVNLFDTPFAYVINSDFDYNNVASAGSLSIFLGDVKLK